MEYEDILKIVGAKVKFYREEKFPDDSFNRIAQRALTKGSIWQKIEEGKYNFTLKFLQRIANTLEVNINELMGIDPSLFSKKKSKSSVGKKSGKN